MKQLSADNNTKIQIYQRVGLCCILYCVNITCQVVFTLFTIINSHYQSLKDIILQLSYAYMSFTQKSCMSQKMTSHFSRFLFPFVYNTCFNCTPLQSHRLMIQIIFVLMHMWDTKQKTENILCKSHFIYLLQNFESCLLFAFCSHITLCFQSVSC